MSDNLKTGKRLLYKWIISIIFTFLPVLLSISYAYKAFLVITIWSIMMWMFELMPDPVVAVTMPVLYVVFNVVKPNIAFDAWSSTTPWVTLGGLIISQVFISSGLVKRIAYKVMLFTGGTFKGLVIGITMIGIIITPLIPSVMSKIALMTPMIIGLCQVMGADKKSKLASALMLVIYFSLWTPKMAVLTASADSVLTADVLSRYFGSAVTWSAWSIDMLIPSLLWTIVSVLIVWVLKPQKINLQKKYLSEEYAKLGSITMLEKKVSIMLLILLILLSTDATHGIHVAWIMIIVSAICFLPGIELIDKDAFSKIPFDVVFFLVASVTIGSVTNAIGMTTEIAFYILEALKGKSELSLILIIYSFAIVANLLLNPLALVATLIIPIAEICQALGYPPLVGGYSLIMGFNHTIFPYEVAPLMMLYGYGWLDLKDLIKVSLVRLALGFGFTILITYPYWKLIGLL